MVVNRISSFLWGRRITRITKLPFRSVNISARDKFIKFFTVISSYEFIQVKPNYDELQNKMRKWFCKEATHNPWRFLSQCETNSGFNIQLNPIMMWMKNIINFLKHFNCLNFKRLRVMMTFPFQTFISIWPSVEARAHRMLLKS